MQNADEHQRRHLFFTTPVGMAIPLNTQPGNSKEASDFLKGARIVTTDRVVKKELEFHSKKGILGFLKDPALYIREWKMYQHDEERGKRAVQRLEAAIRNLDMDMDDEIKEDDVSVCS